MSWVNVILDQIFFPKPVDSFATKTIAGMKLGFKFSCDSKKNLK